MKTKIFNAFLFLIFFLALAPGQSAFAKKDIGDIDITMSVNYGSAYRDGTWVPVDVVVKNKDFNIKGFIEVRTLSNGAMQSPRYSLPADLPKGSVKRFRFHAFLKTTDRVEVMLYDGKRPVMEIPNYITVNPIKPQDVLCLVLDEEPTDFSFLYNALLPERTRQTAEMEANVSTPAANDEPRRLHRESLKNITLPALADHPQCYEPFDMIILGNIEPERISERHRDLLKGYAEKGGVVVVCTGANGAKYRGSWVEEWAGVSIGGMDTIKEPDLASDVFKGETLEGIRPDRDCPLSELRPVASGVKIFGGGKTLATLRQTGQGYVVVLGLDASSRALQGCSSYLTVWNNLYKFRRGQAGPNMEGAGQFCLQQLPFMSGIKVNPRSSVLSYLLLYIGFGIIGNWLFFNKIKRRELSWVSLIFISIGFTLYAMIFGTAGRASQNEIEQITVLRVPKGMKAASKTEYIGILSTRSARRSIKLANEYVLAKDAGFSRLPWVMQRNAGSQANTPIPFSLAGGDTPAIQDLTVAASDIRVVEIQSDTKIKGRIEGKIVLKDGVWQVDLKNNSGLRVTNPGVLIDGRVYFLKSGNNAWKQDMKEGNSTFMNGQGNYYEENSDRARDLFKQNFPGRLFSQTSFNNPYSSPTELDPSIGPYFFGWVEGTNDSALMFDTNVRHGIRETFLIEDIDVERAGQDWILRDLQVSFSDGRYGNQTQISQGRTINFAISVPPWLMKSDTNEINIEFWMKPKKANLSLALLQDQITTMPTPPTPTPTPVTPRVKSARRAAPMQQPVRIEWKFPPEDIIKRVDEPVGRSNEPAERITYRLRDWKKFCTKNTPVNMAMMSMMWGGTNQPNVIVGNVLYPLPPTPSPTPTAKPGTPPRFLQPMGNFNANFRVEARVKWQPKQETKSGGLTGWR